jgi:hypothetical protein
VIVAVSLAIISSLLRMGTSASHSRRRRRALPQLLLVAAAISFLAAAAAAAASPTSVRPLVRRNAATAAFASVGVDAEKERRRRSHRRRSEGLAAKAATTEFSSHSAQSVCKNREPLRERRGRSSAPLPLPPLHGRRAFAARGAASAASLVAAAGIAGAAVALFSAPAPAAGAASSSANPEPAAVAAEKTFAFTPPDGFQQANKPLQTHLYEVQFRSALRDSYKMGITVDPVRIGSLEDFGTPEQVAARVVAAELGRDGVASVTLVDDPKSVALMAPGRTGGGGEPAGAAVAAYVLNYRSEGRRGASRFACKLFVHQHRLYALTAQCREDDYGPLRAEIERAVDSFRLAPPASDD